MSNPQRPILFFDGVCNLCNGAVQYVLKHDRQQQFLFASLQSPLGQQMQQRWKDAHGSVPDSMLLQVGDALYEKSDAALQTARRIGGIGWLAAMALWLPRRFRNWVYDGVARNRYRWFGRQESCWLPTPALKERFLTD